jgi:hypothetical protein
MHQQRFDGITGARTLGFGIDDNLQRRGNLGGSSTKYGTRRYRR